MSIPINSIPPNVVKEATKTRFQISLHLFIGIAYGAYWLGRDSVSGQLVQAKEASELNRKMCKEHVDSLTSSNKRITREVAATQDRQMTIQKADVELKSKVGKKK